MNSGLKQGCTLSPALFNIFINDLIKIANQGILFGECKLNALQYADDLVLVAESPEMLQSLLNVLGQWCMDNYMSINPNKTKIMHIRHPRKEISNKKFHCRGKTIDYIDSYKYLGIIFTEHLSWGRAIENTALSANRAANYLIAKARVNGGFAYEVFTHLYNTLVVPIIEYSSFLWGFKPISQIDKIQNNLMRSFLGLGRNAPYSALIGDTGWQPLSVTTKLSCVRFYKRLSIMSLSRLNHYIFRESCNLTEKGYRNWTQSARELLQSLHQSNCVPTLDNLHSLDYYKKSFGYLFLNAWRVKIKEYGPDSESGGRLHLYREIKKAPSTERYVANITAVGGRRVMAGLRMGCLPLAVETGRYTRVPYRQRVCQLCDRGEVEDQCHFLAICPAFRHLRLKLFNYCHYKSTNFYHLTLQDKIKYILCNYDNHIVYLLTQFYSCRHHILFS